MQSLKASIIINNYNYARFLGAAIDSALSQTYANCEVIVVDDGSTDDSRRVIESYGQKVKPIYKTNGGQGSALNAGFAVSTGELIIFLDADDVLFPYAVETVVAKLQQGVALIRYPLEVINAAAEPSGTYVGGGASRIPSAMFGPFQVDSPGSAKAFPRQVLDRLMPVPEEDCAMGADAYLAALSSVLGEVVCVEESLGRYRIHANNNVAGVKGGLPEIRRSIVRDFSLFASLQKLTGSEIGSREKWLSRYPQHWVNRIASLRESPTDHPWDDRLFELIHKAISATWRQPFWNVRRKLVYSLWVVGYSISPKRIARALKEIEARGAGTLPGFLIGR